jgi:hypothetical protein
MWELQQHQNCIRTDTNNIILSWQIHCQRAERQRKILRVIRGIYRNVCKIGQ